MKYLILLAFLTGCSVEYTTRFDSETNKIEVSITTTETTTNNTNSEFTYIKRFLWDEDLGRDGIFKAWEKWFIEYTKDKDGKHIKTITAFCQGNSPRSVGVVPFRYSYDKDGTPTRVDIKDGTPYNYLKDFGTNRALAMLKDGYKILQEAE
jgi:hypothetical protein